MSHTRKRLLSTAGVALVLLSSLYVNVTVAAQSRRAHKPAGTKAAHKPAGTKAAHKPAGTKAAHKPATKQAAKSAAGPTAINADELQALLKRDDSRPLLVNYWATWCDPCRDEFPDLVKIDAQYRAKGLDFIAISLDDLVDLKTEVPKFLRLMKAKMPVYLLNMADPEPAINMIDRNWGGALPATFLTTARARWFSNTLAASRRMNCARLSKN
jgi:thiol-disulfide isomerase/thioredoxin